MPSKGVGASDPSTIGADVGTVVGAVLGEEGGKPSRYNDGLSHNDVGLEETDGIRGERYRRTAQGHGTGVRQR